MKKVRVVGLLVLSVLLTAVVYYIREDVPDSDESDVELPTMCLAQGGCPDLPGKPGDPCKDSYSDCQGGYLACIGGLCSSTPAEPLENTDNEDLPSAEDPAQ